MGKHDAKNNTTKLKQERNSSSDISTIHQRTHVIQKMLHHVNIIRYYSILDADNEDTFMKSV